MKAIAPLLRTALLAAPLLLAACAAPQRHAPAPLPTPAPRPTPMQPAPRAPADWRDAEQTPGVWNWAVVDGRSTASFGPAGQPWLARLSCDRPAGQVLLARAGNATGMTAMAINTTSANRPLSSDQARSVSGQIVAVLPARDPLLDAIAFSRGRFMLDVAGQAPLYLPSWPEISRVIEDCR